MKARLVFLMVLLIGAPVSAEQSEQGLPRALGPTTIEEIRAQVSQSPSIPSFVGWLTEQANVSNIDYDPRVFLTTYPPQQSVRFSIEGDRYRFLLRIEQDTKVALVSEARSKAPGR